MSDLAARSAGFLLLTAVAACAPRTPEPSPAPAGVAGITVGGVPVEVRVAASVGARARGLRGVRALDDGEGMLFLYRRPRRMRMWMKECHVSLDVAFIDEGGSIQQAATLAPPVGSEPPASARALAPAAMVLELPAGFLRRHGLGPGTRVRLPAALSRARADP